MNSLDLFFQELSLREDCSLKKNIDLSAMSTMRLSSLGHMIEVYSIPCLQFVLKSLKKYNQSYQVIGRGSNLLLPSELNHILIQLKLPFDPKIFEEKSDFYHLPASMSISVLTAKAIQHNIKGWEILTGIPASLGGAIYMNAGTKFGEISQLIDSVQIMNSAGVIREEKMTSKSFSYRKNHFTREGDIILSAVLRHLGQDSSVATVIKNYAQYRKQTQPLGSANCGCVFKNIDKNLPAGKLIDIIGLKGLSQKDLVVSSLHGNFIENKGQASQLEDFQLLIDKIKRVSLDYIDQPLELEVQL